MTFPRRKAWNRGKTMRKRDPRNNRNDWMLRHLDDLCREIVFFRDGYKCWDCQTEITEVRFRKDDGWPWYPGFQWAHVIGRGRTTMKWDPLNQNCSCGRCHELWADSRFSAGKLQKYQLLFPERWAELERLAYPEAEMDRSRPAPKVRIDKARLCEDLEHQYNAIIKRTMAWPRLSALGGREYVRDGAMK